MTDVDTPQRLAAEAALVERTRAAAYLRARGLALVERAQAVGEPVASRLMTAAVALQRAADAIDAGEQHPDATEESP